MDPREPSTVAPSAPEHRLDEAYLFGVRFIDEHGRPPTLEILQCHFRDVPEEQLCEILALLPPCFPKPVMPGEEAGEDAEALCVALGATSPLKKLDSGGQADVYRGEDPVLGREWAVKVLRREHSGRADLEWRFIEEAKVTGRLDHPGVVPVHALGSLPGPDPRPYFTMKLVRGRNLADLLKERADPAQDRPRFLKVFEQVCQTLAYAHSKGVIHRDLKPRNVMVGAYGEVLVMDWGFAKQLGAKSEPPSTGTADTAVDCLSAEQTQRGQVIGTVPYMSPEAARGDVPDERCDVFGLGAVLCELLTGRPPYLGQTWAEVFERAKAGDLADARARLDGCEADAELVGLARRCLDVEPVERPRDAGEVAAAVSAYLTGLETRLLREKRERVARKAKAMVQRRARRVQRVLATILAGLALLGGSGGVWWWYERKAREIEANAIAVVARYYLDAGRSVDAKKSLELCESVGGGLPGMRQRLRQLRDDVTVVLAIDEIRLRLSHARKGHFDPAHDAAAYSAAFRCYGIDVLTLDKTEAVARVTASTVRESLVAALDHWADACEAERERLKAVAYEADDDRWRREFRAAVRAGDGGRLAELTSQQEAQRQTHKALDWLANHPVLAGREREAVVLLTVAQKTFPFDFWANYTLAGFLTNSRPDRTAEAVGYYRAALALRPDSPGVYLNLGNALKKQNDLDGAIACYAKATSLDANYAEAHYLLGRAWAEQNRYAEAKERYRLTLRLLPAQHPLRQEVEHQLQEAERRTAPGR
jgi:serine/threonine-protein kinase